MEPLFLLGVNLIMQLSGLFMGFCATSPVPKLTDRMIEYIPLETFNGQEVSSEDDGGESSQNTDDAVILQPDMVTTLVFNELDISCGQDVHSLGLSVQKDMLIEYFPDNANINLHFEISGKWKAFGTYFYFRGEKQFEDVVKNLKDVQFIQMEDAAPGYVSCKAFCCCIIQSVVCCLPQSRQRPDESSMTVAIRYTDKSGSGKIPEGETLVLKIWPSSIYDSDTPVANMKHIKVVG